MYYFLNFCLSYPSSSKIIYFVSMTDALEILKYTIPAFIVFLAVFFIMKKFMDNEYRKLVFELKRNSQKLTTPIRLQAYEKSNTIFGKD